MNNDIAVAQICKIVTVRHSYCTTKIAYLIKHNYKNQSIAIAAAVVTTAQTRAAAGRSDGWVHCSGTREMGWTQIEWDLSFNFLAIFDDFFKSGGTQNMLHSISKTAH